MNRMDLQKYGFGIENQQLSDHVSMVSNSLVDNGRSHLPPIEEVYPNTDGRYFCESNYQPLLESLPGTIVIQVADDDYQGDSRVLYKNGDEYGILIFGWGSCSGCDSLQACESLEEISELRDSLDQSIVWRSASELYEYVTAKDWELDWAWHADETKEFVEQSTQYLANEVSLEPIEEDEFVNASISSERAQEQPTSVVEESRESEYLNSESLVSEIQGRDWDLENTKDRTQLLALSMLLTTTLKKDQ